MEENFTIIKADHKEIILDIIQSIIKVIINPLKMLLSSNPEQKIDVGKPSLRQLYICYDTIKIEEFLVKNRPYQQLSDHFGVSVELLFPKKAYLNS